MVRGIPIMVMWMLVATAGPGVVRGGTEERLNQILRVQAEIDRMQRAIREEEDRLEQAGFGLDEARRNRERSAAVAKRTAQRQSDLQERLREARRAERERFAELRERLGTDPQVVEAQDALLKAQEAESRERGRVLKPLQETEAYQSADERLQRLRAAGTAAPEKRTEAARQLVEASQAVVAMERAALEVDEAHRAAEGRIVEARAHLAEIRRRITESIRVDADRIAAAQAVAALRKEQAQAGREATAARRRLAAAAAAYSRVEADYLRIERRIDDYYRLLRQYERQLALLTGGRVNGR